MKRLLRALPLALAIHALAAAPLAADDDPLGEAAFQQRAAVVLDTLRGADLLPPGGTGKLPYGLAVARLAADPAHAASIDYIAASGHGGEPPFNAMYQLRGYLMHPESFSAAQAAAIRAAGEAVPDWNQPYTENHKVLLWSSAYLMAQSFPDGQWHWGDQRLNSAQLMSAVRETLIGYGQAVYDRGYGDFLSPTYDLFKAAAWMNLYDFADDTAVRHMADAMLTYHFTLQALGSLQEVILPPYSRGAGSILDNALASSSQWIHWLFWGLGGNGAADKVTASDPEFILALTGWRPPAQLGRIITGQAVDAPWELRAQQPFFLVAGPRHMVRTTWHEGPFAVSSGVYRMDMDSLGVHGDRQLIHDDPFAIAWQSGSPLRYLSVMHPYWDSANGEHSWTSRSSPFMQTVQHRGVAITAFDIPASDPWADVEQWSGQRAEAPLPVALIRYPSAGVDYREWDDDWISLDTGSAWIAIKVLQPGWSRDRRALQAQGFHVIRSGGAAGERWKTAFLFEVADPAAYASLDAFMATVAASPLEVDWDAWEIRYTTRAGSRLRMQYTVSLDVPEFSVPQFAVDDMPVDYSDWPVLESPWTTLAGGLLRIRDPEAKTQLVIDWSGAVPAFDTRPLDPPSGWAGYPARDDGWVDTGDFLGWIYPDGDFVYSLSLGRHVELPESRVGEAGGWLFIP
jgi:hypothetical protein